MSQHRAEPRGGRRAARPARRALWRTGRFRAAVGLVLLGGVATTGTWAYWTDEATVTGTSLTAGTIDLKVNTVDQVTGYAALNLGAMVPGNTSAAVLTIGNSGTAPVRFTGASTATNPDTKNLAGALQVKATADTAVTGSGSSATCAGTAIAGSGTALNAALLPARTLTAGSTWKVCVQVTLPTNAASSLQGGTTAVTLSFTGSSDLS